MVITALIGVFSLVLADLSDSSVLFGSYGSNLLDSPQYNVLGMPVVPTNMTLTFKFTPTETSPSGGTIIRWTEFTPGLNMPTISMLPDSYDFIVCVDGADYLFECTPQTTALRFIPNVSSTVTIIFSGASFDVFINSVFKYKQVLPSAPFSNSKAFLLAGDTRSNGIEASGILTHVSIGSTVYNQTTTGYTNLMKPNDFSPLGDVLDVPESVNITFQITPLGVRSNWASILRMTTNFASRGTAGDRLPAIFFNPNSYSLQICIDGTTWVSGYSEVGCILGTEDPLLTLQPNVSSTVTVIISDSMMTAYVNTEKAYSIFLPGPTLNGISAFVWAGEPYGPSKANAMLSLVEISEAVIENIDLAIGISPVLRLAGTSSSSPTTTKVDLTGRADRQFSFKGFGTSLAWFANVFGNRTDLADILFNCTANNIPFMGRSVPTLCMKIVRYNIGASGPRMRGVGMYTYKMIPQFQNEFGTWDWNADVTQRNMLKNAVARGVNFVEAFANSPPWWMTTARSSAGGSPGNECLLSSNANNYAAYLARVVAQYKNVWNINITSVVASNEPRSTGWHYPYNGQEGCKMSLNLMNQVNIALRLNLQKEKVPITIAAFDEHNFSDAILDLKAKPPLSSFDKFNFHTYNTQGVLRMRTPIRDWGKTNGKEIWVDEYADDDTTGAKTAVQILQDINYAGASAWVYWQAVRDWNPGQNPFSRGLINGTFSGPNNGSYMPWAVKGTIGEVWTKFFVFGHFSRHIRPGFIMLNNTDMANTLTFSDGARKKLIIVTLNTSYQDRPFQMNLKLTADSRIDQWYTHFQKSDTQALYRYSGGVPLNVAEGNVWVNVRARSIQTMEITNVLGL